MNLSKSSLETNSGNHNPISTLDNIPVNNDELLEVLTLAKNGDSKAKEKIISKYYGYIVMNLKEIYLAGYTFEDLVQIGIESILKAINAFDLDKPIAAFSSYMFLTIKNNFFYLCRKEAKNNEVFSLNSQFEDGLESIDLIPSPENLEEIVLGSISLNEFLFRLSCLDSEEFQLIKFLYLDDALEKRHLTNYAKLHEKDYYYCVVLKRRALRKLKKT